MISLQNVSARRAPLALARINVEWGPGVHSIVGTREDGGPLLLALLAGMALPRAGQVRILDRLPDQMRKETARVPLEPGLPDALRVDEVLAVASRLRSEAPRDPMDRLAQLGIEALARRTVRSLSRAEARAVSLVEALTSTRVRVVLIEEPATWMDPRAAGRVAEGLRAKAQAGCAVVFTTTSARDASELAVDHVLMHRGTVVSGPSSADPRLSCLRRARLVLVSQVEGDARMLAAGLARNPAVTGLGQEGAVVWVRGDDPIGLARATASTAVETGADIVEMRWEFEPLGEARSQWSDPPGAMRVARLQRNAQTISPAARTGPEPEPAS